MKNLGLIIGLSSIMVLASCSNSNNETADEVPTESSTSSSTTTTTTTRTNDDGTTIQVDRDGFEVGKKDGSSETQVKVTTDSTKIRIKK